MSLHALPEEGVPAAEILAELGALRDADLPTHGGRLFAYVYDPAVEGLDALTASAHALAAHVNGLDPTAFPSLLATENALVGAAAQLLGGGPDTVGTVTGGGTESLILAVKAARDAHPEITAPRLVIPETAHAAFLKAAHYLRVAVDRVPVDPRTLKASPKAIKRTITPETVLVACSAPSYAHGVIDPVAEIAEIAAAQGIRCHVDACFGGWTLPYLRRLGLPIPAFDLSADGVTSISVDLHKYAYAPKGVSVLLHANAALRRPQYFASADWPGYTMLNPGLASTRSGGPIAAAYATLRHLGESGYRRLAARTLGAVRALAEAVRSTEGLRLLVEPETTVVCLIADDPGLDVFVLADELAARGWHTQPQLGYGEIPPTIHLTVTAAVAATAADFAPALAEATAAARAHGPVVLPDELIALATTLTPEALTPELVAGLAESLGVSGGGVPSATVNALLDVASPRLREQFLVEFLSLLQRPSVPPLN
ncbi:pyridoxal phosphate-dependent decarboxylase family protein [Catenuloplanes sp. NPDC051500]|uniref:pyridoxal phosphate-dependent decarboxylase family protein n=1 Tax=Catenuloplanes sp. NPDC051500 TaxID=3363959 RepID=UPI0037BDC412